MTALFNHLIQTNTKSILIIHYIQQLTIPFKNGLLFCIASMTVYKRIVRYMRNPVGIKSHTEIAPNLAHTGLIK